MRCSSLSTTDCLSAAILDQALGDGDSSQLCERLNERGIPFSIHSGYEKLDGACAGAPHISKPASPSALLAAMENLIAGTTISEWME